MSKPAQRIHITYELSDSKLQDEIRKAIHRLVAKEYENQKLSIHSGEVGRATKNGSVPITRIRKYKQKFIEDVMTFQKAHYIREVTLTFTLGDGIKRVAAARLEELEP